MDGSKFPPRKTTVLTVCLSLLNIAIAGAHRESRSPWHEAVDKLMTRMSANERPPAPSMHPATRVFVTVDVLHFGGVIVPEGMASATFWIQLKWVDARMARYHPETQKDIVVSPDKVWIPDVTFINAVEPLRKIYRSPVTYNSKGEATLVQTVGVTSSCSTARATLTQICVFKLGSWTYGSTEQELVPAHQELTLRNGWTNSRWTLGRSSIAVGRFAVDEKDFESFLVTLAISVPENNFE